MSSLKDVRENYVSKIKNIDLGIAKDLDTFRSDLLVKVDMILEQYRASLLADVDKKVEVESNRLYEVKKLEREKYLRFIDSIDTMIADEDKLDLEIQQKVETNEVVSLSETESKVEEVSEKNTDTFSILDQLNSKIHTTPHKVPLSRSGMNDIEIPRR